MVVSTYDEFCFTYSEYCWLRLFQKSLQERSLFNAAVKRLIPYDVEIFIIPLSNMQVEKIIKIGKIKSWELYIENFSEKYLIKPISNTDSGVTKIEIKGINKEIDNTSVKEFTIENSNNTTNCFFLLMPNEFIKIKTSFLKIELIFLIKNFWEVNK